MRTKKATQTLAWLLTALASSTVGCAAAPAPALTPASPALARLSVYADPDATVVDVKNERGRELVAPFHDAVAKAMSDAGYHLVDSATAPHDLTVHMRLARVGFNYGTWADGVVLEVTAGGQAVGQVARKNLNFVHLEGADTPARLTFAAHTLVNSLSHEPSIEQYAENHPGGDHTAPMQGATTVDVSSK